MFTLFNLQGTHRIFPVFCSCFIAPKNSARNFFILAHLFSFVKNFFQILFEIFQCRALLSKQLAYNTLYIPICQPLFSIFCNFFKMPIFGTFWGHKPLEVVPLFAAPQHHEYRQNQPHQNCPKNSNFSVFAL